MPKKYKIIKDFSLGEVEYKAGNVIGSFPDGAPEGHVEEIVARASTEGEKVSVPKSLLEEVLANQKKLEESIASRDREIERLTYAADKSRLGIWDSRNAQGQLIRKFNVGIWEYMEGDSKMSAIIRGWRMISDEVNVEDNGGVRRLVEKQVMRLFLDQGIDPDTGKDRDFKEIDTEYVRFYRNVKRRTGEVIKESRDENGDYRTIRFDDGRTVEMDIRFLNI